MIKRSIIISILIIFASILFNFSYSQTSTSSATSSDATTSKEKGDVYARASETYKYVSSFLMAQVIVKHLTIKIQKK